MSEQKSGFELSPSVSILVAGVVIAGAILLTHYLPAAQGGAASGDTQNAQASIQQQMSPELYLALAKQLGVDEAKYQSCVDNKTYQAKIDAQSAEGQKAGGQGTPFTIVLDTKTKKALPVSGALPYEQFKAAIAAVNTDGTASTVTPPSASEHIVGSPTAPIVLIEYSDLQCPYCQMVHPTLQKLVTESNGEIAWVYRNFPLYQIHPQAEPVANAIECVTAQLGNDAFWKFANTIFEG